MSKKLKLTDREWREFALTDFFNPMKGNQNNMASLVDGELPLISAKKGDNGVKAFVFSNKKSLFPQHCITLNLDGDGGAGLAFYQEYSFALDSHVVALYPKFSLDKFCLLFIARSISAQRSRFGHGRAINKSRLNHFLLVLPIQANRTPDWEFMSNYMKQVEDELLSEVRPKLEAQLLEHIISLGALKDRDWREFVFGDVFDIQATSSGIDKKKLFGGIGNVPYLTRTDNNNGIDGFVEPQEASNLDEGNVITIGLDTQTVFYQESSFYTGQNIQVVRHKKLDKYNALFIIRTIKMLVQKFSWGSYGATLTRLRRGKLFLPIQSDGTPDWEFMSAFMQRVEQETLGKALQFFKLRCEEKQNGGGKMQPYFIEDVLFIANGVRLTKADMQEGSRPFVGASEASNGVTAFIENSNVSLDSNVLGVNYNGSVGFSFYHPYEALFSDDVKRVHWKDETANNKYTLLYLSTAIAQQRSKYAYGYKFNAQRMKRQIIMLPSSEDGSPDYAYMEQTMRVMEYDVLKTYLMLK